MTVCSCCMIHIMKKQRLDAVYGYDNRSDNKNNDTNDKENHNQEF